MGIKVANCVSLFGLHHMDAFPIDVWMKRILTEQYPAGYPYEKYAPFNGICQQYMFAFYRHKDKEDAGYMEEDIPSSIDDVRRKNTSNSVGCEQ